MAVQTRATLLANIAADLANNVSGDISAQDIRDICTDIVDSMALPTSDSFVSPLQAIAAGALRTIPHGLGSAPVIDSIVLVCNTADNNWLIGDRVTFQAGVGRANNTGMGVYVDATNIYIRFGSTANPIEYLDKTSGNAVNLTNTSWDVEIRAHL